MQVNQELKNLIPPLQAEEYELLEESIIKDGCRDSLITWNEFVIDGHNRYEICQKHDIPFTTTEKQFDNINEAKEWMINNQFSRRNLPLYQRSVLALKLKPLIAERAKINMATQTKQGYHNCDEAVNTNNEIARQAGVSHNTIARVEKIEEQAPEEVKAKLRSGDISINQAYKEIKNEKKKQVLIERKQEYIERTEIALSKINESKIDIYNTDKKFRIIYADPCWSYNDKQNTDKLGGATKHYDTMSIKELSELPVRDITETDAVLFIWVTSPLLEECFTVIKEWGFKYKTSFIWDKVSHNMGHYNSVRHEFLLIATKGSCTPDNIKLYDSVQSIERSEHSAKPKEFMDIIDDIYIYGDRLEMFARKQSKDKWLYWGDEI